MRSALVWIFLAGISIGSVLCQNQSTDSPPRTLNVPSAAVVTDAPMALTTPCAQNPGYCFVDDSVTATLKQVTDGIQGNYNQIRLNMRIENHTDAPLWLAYRAHTSILVDEFENTYFCCPSKDAPDASATGIGLITGKEDAGVGPLLRIEPRQASSVTFQVWGHRARSQEFPYFHYDVTLEELYPNNPKRVLKSHALYFGDFTATWHVRRSNGAQRDQH